MFANPRFDRLTKGWLNRLKTLGNQDFKHDEHWPLKHFETMSHCSFPIKDEEKEPTNMGNRSFQPTMSMRVLAEKDVTC
jgi:hypothetical protein